MASQHPQSSSQPSVPSPGRRGILDTIEWLGNKLPEPALIFAILAAVVIVVSAVAVSMDWSVQPRRLHVRPRSDLPRNHM